VPLPAWGVVLSCTEARRAGQFFRIWPDATISIARITDSDSRQRGQRGASRDRNYADSCRLVTPGDGKMDPVGHMGISTTSSLRGTKATQQQHEDRYTDPRRRGRTNVCTHSRGRAATDPCRGRHDVPCRPEDGHAVGQGRKANVDPYTRGAPALPGDRGPCTARGYPAAAFRVAPAWRAGKEGGTGTRAVALLKGGARPAGFGGTVPAGEGSSRK
jgi:hypothetical protein